MLVPEAGFSQRFAGASFAAHGSVVVAAAVSRGTTLLGTLPPRTGLGVSIASRFLSIGILGPRT